MAVAIYPLFNSKDDNPKLKTMLRARHIWVRFNLPRSRQFCSTNAPTTKPTNNSIDKKKIESNISKYEEAYRQLDNLDFMTAAKILFSDPPKKKKFGLDFHLVQLFFACLPSLAVYLVAQYARHEMKKMDAELEEKKKKEQEKAKELELKAIEEKEARSAPQLLEFKERLDKLEEAVKEIVVESKKQLGGSSAINEEDSGEKKQLTPNEPGNIHSKSESSKSPESDNHSKQKSLEVAPSSGQGEVTGSAPIPDAFDQDQKGKPQNGATSQHAK